MGDWKNGILGVVVGDALGCPVQFESREMVKSHPIEGMRGHGTFDLPAGSWTDDSSLTLATLDSIINKGKIDVKDIADNFVEWLKNGKYTPYGYAYDIGNGCYNGIINYTRSGKPMSGGAHEHNNGNGSLMRIMPACLYAAKKINGDAEAVQAVENVSAITHGHERAKIACVIYYFIVKNLLNTTNSLYDCIQYGINDAEGFYKGEKELEYYFTISVLDWFADAPEYLIRSSGYVVDSLNAAVWCLINTTSYRDAMLKAANLGGDTDTICAIAGGLAGLYYGIGGKNGIPQKWIDALQRKDWILSLCEKADEKLA